MTAALLFIALCLCPPGDDVEIFQPFAPREYYVAPSDPAFDCRIDGWQICGPGNNPDGFSPGYYGPALQSPASLPQSLILR